jgi:DNA-binding transcriptional MerR regulator
MNEQLLRIGELSARAAVSPRTVDFYTRLGLLAPTSRTGGNFRLYHPDDVARIETIRRLEALGMRLQDIVAALPHETDGAVQDGDGSGLSRLLSTLERDLQALRAAVPLAGPQAQRLLASLTVRAQALIAAGLALTSDLTDVLPPM